MFSCNQPLMALRLSFKCSRPPRGRCRFLTTECRFFLSTDRFLDMAGMFSCIARLTCARDCTLSDCYNALDDPVHFSQEKVSNYDKLRMKSFEIPHLIVALEWLERVHSGQGRRITCPLQSLPVCDNVDILHAVDGVEKFDEALFVVRLSEPGSVVEQAEWSAVGCVVALEVLHDHFEHTIRVGWIGAGVTHRATAAIQILPHHHWHFPDSRITLGWTWRDHAVMEHFVVEGVWPTWWAILVHRHR